MGFDCWSKVSPPIRTTLLQALHTDSILTAEWLLRKHNAATSTLAEAKKELKTIFSQPNPYTPGSTYTEKFLKDQWREQRAAQGSKVESQATRKLKLASLFELQERVERVR